MIYTVTFNPAVDYVVHVQDFREGRVNRTASEEIQFGGKGINVSGILKNLGLESIALGFVAGFTGQAVEKALVDAGIKTDFIHLPDGLTRINVKIKGQIETEINGQGPSISCQMLDRLYQKLEQLCGGDVLVLAGSIPASLPGDMYEQILARLQEKEMDVAVDATGSLLQNVLKYRPFLIKPNHFELEEICGKKIKTQEDVCSCARMLQQQGARNVLVSMAADGAFLLDENGGTHRLAAPQGQVKNSVGAGDSMVAGFLAGWLKERDYGKALRLGVACGSATAFSERLATREEIETVLKAMNG